METTVILGCFHGGILPNQRSLLFSEKVSAAPISRGALKDSFSQAIVVGKTLVSSKTRQTGIIVPCAKRTVTACVSTSSAATSEKTSQGSLENKSVQQSTFPNGFEALVMNVCDETSIAELKLKVGTFELHLKRDIGNAKVPFSAAPSIPSPTTAPPIPSEPMDNSALAAQPVPQKSSSALSRPFASNSSSKALKLEALEASGTKSYVLVSSPSVGTFRSGRTLKGKKQPPSCKEGDLIKEGQVIGYLDQFGNELPIRSDVAGEVLKFLFRDGEAVGYGDPLVAVLPSFHGIIM